MSPYAMSSSVYLYIVFPFISFKLATRHTICCCLGLEL